MSNGAGSAVFFPCDVSLQSSVIDLAALVRTRTSTLDLVVHTADVLRTTRLNTPENVEVAFATNCLSRVLINHLLLDTMRAGTFVVHIAAAGLPGPIDPECIPPPSTMSAIAAHNLGQRANDLYGLSLAQHLASRGIRVMVMQPGMVATSIRTSSGSSRLLRFVARTAESLLRPLMTRPDDYAKRLLALIDTNASEPSSTHVLFDRRFRPMKLPKKYADRDLTTSVWNKLHAAVRLDPNDLA